MPGVRETSGAHGKGDGGAAASSHYTCPMHPQYRSDHPGKCPVCGMDLEPMEHGDGGAAASKDHEKAAGVLTVTGLQQQLLGVDVETVGEAGGSHTLRLSGRVTPDERLDYSINAGVDGTIREVSGVTTGSRVRKGEVLGTYTAPDFVLAVQSFVLALEGLETLRTNRAREAAASGAGSSSSNTLPDEALELPPIISRTEAGLVVNSGNSNLRQRIDRLQLLGMPDEQIDEIRRVRDVPASIRIVAPANGTVLSRGVTPGLKFMRGDEWFRIADLRRVWVLVDVPGSEIEHAHAGQEARIKIPGMGKTLAGRVSDVAPLFDAATRTFKLRVEADNPGEILKPDMFVDVELPVPVSQALSVPADAIVDTGVRQTVYVEHAPGEFLPREVETGWRRGGRIEILRGLSAGDRVVTSGTFLLESERRMRGGR